MKNNDNEPSYYAWAPDDPEEAHFVEVDRRIKMVGADPEYLRVLARALVEAHCFADMDHAHEVDDCDACQAKQWTSEFLRAVATQAEHPRADKEPMTPAKHRALWDAMARTVEAYPQDAANVGERVRSLMHVRCRSNANHGSDEICGECQLLTVLGGACMHASLMGLVDGLKESSKADHSQCTECTPEKMAAAVARGEEIARRVEEETLSVVAPERGQFASSVFGKEPH